MYEKELMEALREFQSLGSYWDISIRHNFFIVKESMLLISGNMNAFLECINDYCLIELLLMGKTLPGLEATL